MDDEKRPIINNTPDGKSKGALTASFKKNLAYTLRKNRPDANTFVLRPSSELVNFKSSKLAVAFHIAQILSQQFDDNRGITEADLADLKKKKVGYCENSQG